MKRLLCLAFLALCLCFSAAAAEGVFVTPIEDLPDDFIFGADISSVLSLEQSGVRFYSRDGQESDLFALLKENGWTSVRARVWVDPFDEQGNSYGGGGGSLENACEIGRRAAANGLSLLVDFHYSDFWADPNKQQCPKAWVGQSIDEKVNTLYEYTKDSLQKIAASGADIVMVQVGNETDNALAGETGWTNIARLINAGSFAVRETLPGALVAVHFSQPKADYARILKVCRADYDVFAASFYPYWHGSLDNMTAQLQTILKKYGKALLIAETAYPHTAADGDFHANSVPDTGTEMNYNLTVQGQANALIDVVSASAKAGCIGVYYWEPAWLPVPGDTFEQQSALWEKFGSGWASSYAAGYDPEDAGIWYGGSAWDNQALFAFDGTALPTLSLPLYARTGAKGVLAIDGYDTPRVTCYLADGVTLPKTVDAVYTDGSRSPTSVTWAREEKYALGEYTISGKTSDGAVVSCLLVVTAGNALQNPSFEEEDMSMYQLTVLSGAEVYRAKSANDAKTGAGLLHFFDNEKVEFNAEQTVRDLTPGHYTFSLSIHGGDVQESDMYIYVKLNGELFATAPMGVTKWREWQRPTIENIPVTEATVVTVGAYVRASGAKPWGKLDDWMLALTP